MVNVEILYTADCPNAAELIDHLTLRAGIDLRVTLVTAARPVPGGFAGSPTVLIDGVNPFGGVQLDAPACALYAPTIAQVDAYLSSSSARGTIKTMVTVAHPHVPSGQRSAARVTPRAGLRRSMLPARRVAIGTVLAISGVVIFGRVPSTLDHMLAER